MPRSQLTVLTCAVRIILLFTAYISFRHAGSENGTSTIPLQKGGVPAAPSGTATLLRLSPKVCTRPGNVFTAPWLMRDY